MGKDWALRCDHVRLGPPDAVFTRPTLIGDPEQTSCWREAGARR